MPESSPAPVGLIGAAALVATLAAALLWADMLAAPLRLIDGLSEARTQLADAEKALSAGGIKKARSATARGSAAVRRARAGFLPDSPLLVLARLEPRVDDAIGQTGHLVAALEHSAAAAEGTLEIAQGALRGPDKIVLKDVTGKRGGSRIRIGRVQAVGELISDIRSEVRGAARELAAVDPRKLPSRFRGPLAEGLAAARGNDEVLADAEAGFKVLPAILGVEGPRRYLLGMQNSAELRGTGGAMLRFALFSVDHGKLELEPDQSVYDVDVNREPLDIPLPEDAWYLREIPDSQRFGNSNWSPDWPLSATAMLDYAEVSERQFQTRPLPPIDGFFAIDPVVMQETLHGVGGFKTSGGRQVNAAKVVNLFLNRAYAATPNPGIRRATLSGIVEGYYRNLLRPRQPTELIDGFGRSLGQKHMQVWFRDDAEQAFAERMNWDGAIEQPESGDYLDVVQQNVGGNKLDFFASMNTNLDVSLSGDKAKVETEVLIHNGAFLPQARYVLGNVGRAAETLGRGWALHRPMINVYVPEAARLRSAAVEGTRIDAPVAATWPGPTTPATHSEKHKTVWSATLEIPLGTEGAFRLAYTVPHAVVAEGDRSVYRLALQHQPKVRPEEVTLRVALPPGARGIVAAGFERRSDSVVWAGALRRDRVLEVSWRS
jgi:hypothetical protein